MKTNRIVTGIALLLGSATLGCAKMRTGVVESVYRVDSGGWSDGRVRVRELAGDCPSSSTLLGEPQGGELRQGRVTLMGDTVLTRLHSDVYASVDGVDGRKNAADAVLAGATQIDCDDDQLAAPMKAALLKSPAHPAIKGVGQLGVKLGTRSPKAGAR